MHDMMKMERLAWIVALVIVATWGIARNPEHPAHDTPPDLQESSRRSTVPATGIARSRMPSSLTERTDTADRAARALRNPDPLGRIADFLAALSSCDAAGLDRIASDMEALQATGISFGPETELVNYRAGQLKGAELLSGRTGAPADIAVLGSLRKQLEGWLQTDPMKAQQWLDQLPPGKFRDEMSVTGIATTAKSDPAAAIRQASALPAAQQTAAGRAAAEALTRSAPATEIAALLQSAPSSTDTGYLTSLVDTLINAPEGDILADTLPAELLAGNSVSSATLLRASSARAKLDPIAALDWASSLEGKKSDLPPGAVLSAAVRGMSLDDLARAEQWATAHPDAANLPAAIAEHRSLLENRGNDESGHDRDD